MRHDDAQCVMFLRFTRHKKAIENDKVHIRNCMLCGIVSTPSKRRDPRLAIAPGWHHIGDISCPRHGQIQIAAPPTPMVEHYTKAAKRRRSIALICGAISPTTASASASPYPGLSGVLSFTTHDRRARSCPVARANLPQRRLNNALTARSTPSRYNSPQKNARKLSSSHPSPKIKASRFCAAQTKHPRAKARGCQIQNLKLAAYPLRVILLKRPGARLARAASAASARS